MEFHPPLGVRKVGDYIPTFFSEHQRPHIDEQNNVFSIRLEVVEKRHHRLVERLFQNAFPDLRGNTIQDNAALHLLGSIPTHPSDGSLAQLEEVQLGVRDSESSSDFKLTFSRNLWEYSKTRGVCPPPPKPSPEEATFDTSQEATLATADSQTLVIANELAIEPLREGLKSLAKKSPPVPADERKKMFRTAIRNWHADKQAQRAEWWSKQGFPEKHQLWKDVADIVFKWIMCNKNSFLQGYALKCK